jgi:transcription elongation factor GreA
MMMPEQVTFLTPRGYEKVRQELDRLCNVRRPQIIKQLQEALEQASAQASALENPDYEAAKNEQAFVEGRILQLEQILNTAVIIEEPPTKDAIGLGSKVTITEGEDGAAEHYTIVGSVEADPGHGFISNESPLGRALMGHKIGDRVIVSAPDGAIEFLITAVD